MPEGSQWLSSGTVASSQVGSYIPPTDPPTCHPGTHDPAATQLEQHPVPGRSPRRPHRPLRTSGADRAVAEALEHLIQRAEVPKLDRPARDHGTVEITLRLPVQVADDADRWRAAKGLSRQATVEYAVLTALEVAS